MNGALLVFLDLVLEWTSFSVLVLSELVRRKMKRLGIKIGFKYKSEHF